MPLPLVTTVCQTNPVTAECLQPPTTSVSFTMGAGDTPTVAVFAAASAEIAADPATRRLFVRARNSASQDVGGTSIAVQTRPGP